jgi:dTDP-4-amino-4,6-dideoxygalactose transaminase
MTSIYALSVQYGFKIIEDASHAIGGRYKNEPIGNCHYSHITVFSFHPVKIITSGEGGMAVSNDANLTNKMRLLRSHGISVNTAGFRPQRKGDEIWNYQQIGLGFNYRMTDMQAALGLAQLQRLNEFVAKRHVLAQRYSELLAAKPVIIPWQHIDGYSAYHLYVLRINCGQINKTKRQVYDGMRAAGVGVNLHYIPVYRQPYYEQMGFQIGHCPQAELYFADALTIPMYPELTEAQQEHIVAMLDAVLAA